MNYTFCDLKLAPFSLVNQWKAAISEVIDSGVYISGSQKKLFESRFAEMINSQFALGVSNGLDGLTIALKALGADKNSLVAVPEHTFIATYNAVDLVGSNLIPVKIGEDALMDLDELEQIYPTPDFVIPVHMHGSVVNMDRLMNWARQRKIKVIEDSSQAHFSSSGSRFAGTFADVGVFSLYPTKNLGALGDAGVVVTNNSKIYEKMKSIANYGSSLDSKYIHECMGVNARLDEFQAAILNVNLNYIHEWNKHRKVLGKIYENIFELNNVSYLKQKNSIYHHFIIFPRNREFMRKNLENSGIGTDIHYPITAIEEYSKFKGIAHTEISDFAKNISRKSLSLPLHHWMNSSVIESIAKKVVEFDS